MRQLLLVLLLLCSCGSREHVPECRGEANTFAGLTVRAEPGEAIEPLVLTVIRIVDTYVNQQHPGLYLPGLFMEHEAHACYVEYPDMPKDESGRSKLGFYRNGYDQIYVGYLPLDPEKHPEYLRDKCTKSYYILAHEMLHFIAERHLEVDNNTNSEHNHSIFMERDEKNKMILDGNRVENHIYTAIVDGLCDKYVLPYVMQFYPPERMD